MAGVSAFRTAGRSMTHHAIGPSRSSRSPPAPNLMSIVFVPSDRDVIHNRVRGPPGPPRAGLTLLQRSSTGVSQSVAGHTPSALSGVLKRDRIPSTRDGREQGVAPAN